MTTQEWLLLLNLIVGVVIAAFWLIYVNITNKTFKEIKRQTDLQSDALLLVTSETTETKPENVIDREHSTSVQWHQEWEEIIKDNIEIAAGRNQYLILTLENRGKCDINKWKINFTLTVDPGEYIRSKFDTPSKTKHWSIEKETNEEKILPDHPVRLCVANLGAYPGSKISWTIEFSDIRRKDYTIFSGPNSATANNTLAFKKSLEPTSGA